MFDIKVFKILGLKLLTIKYDGLYDIYYLFDKFAVCKRENDRYFWNDWE